MHNNSTTGGISSYGFKLFFWLFLGVSSPRLPPVRAQPWGMVRVFTTKTALVLYTSRNGFEEFPLGAWHTVEAEALRALMEESQERLTKQRERTTKRGQPPKEPAPARTVNAPCTTESDAAPFSRTGRAAFPDNQTFAGIWKISRLPFSKTRAAGAPRVSYLT